MTLVVESGTLSVCRLDPGAPWPSPPPGAGIYALTRTTDEFSIVCAEGAEPTGSRIEPGWRALRIVGPLAFELVGVVASVAVPLADSGIGVFIVSTYDTDLILVKGTDLDLAIRSLESAGHTVVASSS